MSATVYRVLKWCTLSPDEITQIVKDISHGHIYDGKDFYEEVEKRNAWEDATEMDDEINIWRDEEADSFLAYGKECSLHVGFDEMEGKYVSACIYEK
jgi:hypothetical protein